MAKANNKTQITETSVEGYLDSIADEQQRADARRLLDIFKRVTGEEPKMWGPSIIGFGLRHLAYDSGREMDWMVTGFSPRKGNLTFYLGLGALDGPTKYDDHLARLGKHTTGKGCLYVKRLSNVDEAVLEELVSAAYSNNKD
jgi:hypothetical protein